MTSCRETRTRAFAAAEGALSIEDTLACEAHAAQCAACAAHVARVARLHSALTASPEPPVERVDVERNVRAIGAAIDRAVRVREARLPRRRIAVAILAFASVAAAAVAFWTATRDEVSRERSPLVATSMATEEERGPATSVAVEPPTQEASADDPSEASGIHEPIDLARLESVRADVRGRLVEFAPLLGADSDAQSVARFVAAADESFRELARQGWPIARLVEAHCTAADPVVANAALRWIGVRGDRVAWTALKRALDDPERAPGACLALVDARAVDVLASAMAEPRTRDAASAALLDRGESIVSDVVERCARSSTPRPGSPLAVRLAGVLASRDASAVGRALVLASEGFLDEADVVGALAARRAIGPVLAEALRAKPRGLDPRIGVRAAWEIGAPGAADWLEQAARELVRGSDARTARMALEAIARCGDADGLRALLRLGDSGRFSALEIDPVVETMLEEFPDVAVGIARDARSTSNETRALHARLASSPSAATAPAFVALAASRSLPNADRRLALLCAAENGDASLVEPLVALATTLGRGERDVRAACLVALATLGTREDVLRALGDAPARTKSRVCALLDGREARDKPTTTLLKLSRELESMLALPQS